jgi:hypothetical protein
MVLIFGIVFCLLRFVMSAIAMPSVHASAPGAVKMRGCSQPLFRRLQMRMHHFRPGNDGENILWLSQFVKFSFEILHDLKIRAGSTNSCLPCPSSLVMYSVVSTWHRCG